MAYRYETLNVGLKIVHPCRSSSYTWAKLIVELLSYSVICWLCSSSVNELAQYGSPKFQVGVPVIANGQIWGAISDINSVYTAYTITNVNYYDYSDGTTIFFQQSSGLTSNNLTSVPITKDEVLLKVIDQAQVQTDVFVERGKNSAYERVQRLGEVDNLGDMINYGYGFFNVDNKKRT